VRACCDSELDIQPGGAGWGEAGGGADHLYSAAFLTRQYKPSRHISPQPEARASAGSRQCSFTKINSFCSTVTTGNVIS